MKRIIFVLLAFIFLNGCKTTSVLTTEVTPGRVFNATLSSIGTSETPYYICDEFFVAVYDKFTVEEIESKYSKLLKKKMNPAQNIHDPNVTDTIISFSSRGNAIKFYRAEHADLIFHIELTDPRIILFENLRPGMSKADFQNKFSLRNETPNTIHIGTKAVTSYFIFHFRSDKLVKIDSDLYID
jgi:hypothetical protein